MTQPHPPWTFSKHSSILETSPIPKGWVGLPNRMNFRKNSKRPSDPPPPLSFSQNYIANFFNGYWIMEKFQRGGSAFIKVCLVLIFLKTIVEKHTLNPEVPNKLCNISFLIEIDHLPPAPHLWTFSENSSDLVALPVPKCDGDW